jgi:hypothetical protein
MKKTNLLYAFVNWFALCAFGTASASPPGADPRLLSLVPPGAAIVAEVTYGSEPMYLVLTRNNAADLMDLQSISGVDPTRTIARTVFVATRGSQGLISEHSLLASGRFDPRHIFKAAMENGAIKTEYAGIPVLIVRPLDRDKGISRDLRWLAFIDSQIAIFGTIAMVQEELSRYLARSPADGSLLGRLSHLHSNDRSRCVLAPTIHNKEVVRRTLAALDPSLRWEDHANDGLIMGIHFGRRVEIEYETVPDSAGSDGGPPQAQPVSSPSPNQIAPHLASFLSNRETTLLKVVKFSKRQYGEFIAQEQARELTYVEQMSSQPTRK